MSEFCEQKGIKREFNIARTPQQNSVTERRNRTLIEAARTMLADSKLPTTFWAEAVNTACYVQNRVLVVKPHNKTPYELFRGRTPALSFMRPFGCHVTILNTLDYLGKFDGKSDEGFFVGYSMNSKAFRVYNIRTRKVEENLHIRFLEDKPIIAGDGPKWLFDIDVLTKSMNYVPVVAGTNSNDFVDVSLFDSSSKNASNDESQPSSDVGKKNDKDNATLEATHVDLFGDETEVDMSNITTAYLVPSTLNTRIHKDHSLDHVIGDVQSGVQTRIMTKTTNEQGFICAVYEGKTLEDLYTCLFACFLSQVEPKKVIQALTNPSWIEAMHDKFPQFKLQKGYTQEERIDYDEVFAPVARIEAIRLFLAYALFMNFVVYQMDVKSAFLYGKIEEEVYVCQPAGFEDPEFPDRVYKVENALYGLHQAPEAWYETLSTYLLDNGFQRGQIDKTLFIKRVKSDILLVQVYVDDIIFGSTKKELCIEFEKLMHKNQDKYVDEILKRFGFSTVKTTSTPMETLKPLMKNENAEDVDVYLYRSMIVSLMYLTSTRHDIMFAVCACARFQVTPKVSHLYAVKRIFRYLKGQPKLGIWYPMDSPFDLEAYSDSDYAGASLDRKSTTGVANSTTEAEYVAAASCCGQYRYALTENPTIYVSLIKQFWETTTARTLDNGEIKLTATIDGKVKIVTEASIRRHLQLADSDGISSLPTTEIFEQLSLMGVKDQHTPTSGPLTSQPPVSPTFKRTTRQEFVVHKPRSPTRSLLVDEAASTGVYVRYGGATTTVTGLEVGQGSGNIDKTPTMPYDSPLPRVNTLRSDKGSMTQQELMVFYTTLSKKVESLETDLKQTKQIYGAAYTRLIKKVKKLEKTGRKIDEINQDPDISLVQHDAEIQGRYGHDMDFDFDFDAAKEVSTAKKDISTVEPVSTAGATVTTASVAAVSIVCLARRVSTVDDITMDETLVYIRMSAAKDKGKGKMAEFETVQTKTKTKLQQEQERLGFKAAVRLQDKLKEEERQRIARVHEAASYFNVEEWEDIQARVKADEELAQRLQVEEREIYSEAEQERMLVELINQSKREGNRHLHAGREGVSIVKGNSYIDGGSKALGGSR
ncbi:putative ribonuclease H-like domain-containing protein [Tanacetum coccineum]